jgi:sterol desaturase/sphingolipid hydroxylase (fatty acid hydroxylase superfamily)
MKLNKLLKNIAAPVAALGAFGLLIWIENRRPLRRSVESKFVRNFRNMAVAGATSGALYLVEKPVTDRLTKLVERHNFGLLKIIKLPRQLELVSAVVLLDYTLYVWHVLTHKIPFLWRFHLVHHTDLDLDASTAIRFHFGELIISVAWRAAQIVVIGVSPAALKIWQVFLFPSVFFHHSNIELPAEFEKNLSRFITTPRLHGIHHSAVLSETDSNWSSGLTVWDWLHGTLKTNVQQAEIVIGVPAFQNPEDVVLAKIIKLPFETQKPSWRQLTEENRAENNLQ